jgi:proteasome lid subunit RPN8/RPN11
MWQPSDQILEAAFAHARDGLPLEACGLVISGKYHRVRNLTDERDHFSMDMAQVIKLTGGDLTKIEAFVHSHAFQPPFASIADLASCESMMTPWLIVAMPLKTYQVIEPSGFMAPLIGRPWCWGSLDCYGLVRDAYKMQAGIEIPNFTRNWGWWEEGEDLIETQFSQAGFVALGPDEEFKALDVIGCKVRCAVVNHVAVWQAGDYILHHLAGRYSVLEPYNGFFRKCAHLHLRHQSLLAAHNADSAVHATGENAG